MGTTGWLYGEARGGTPVNWLVGHMVGDYLLQTAYQAENKKQDNVACLAHVLVYALTLWAFTQWALWKIGLIFVTHYLQDRTQFVRWFNKATGKGDDAWLLIVVDNTFHFLVLYGLSLAPERL